MDSYAFYFGMQEFLSKGKIPDNRALRRKLKRASTNFTIKDNRLFYIGPSKKYMRLVVLSEEEKRSVLTECHNNPRTGNHGGVRGTQNRVIAGYYWPTIIQDVKEWIRSCQHCQLNDPVKSVDPVSHSIKVKEAWDVLVLDLIGPLPETARNNKYVLSMIDLYTKWVIAEPIQSKTAAEVSAVITTKLYSFGMVRKIITDQGKEFVNQLNSSIFSMLKIKNAVSSVYHSRTNGKDERINKNIKRTLRKYVNDNHNDWDLNLPAMVFGINTTKQESTRRSPYFLLFKRHPRLPGFMNACPMGDDFEGADPEDNIDTRGNKPKLLNETVQAGDDVLLSRDPKKQQTGDTFTSQHQEPDSVSSISSKGVAAIVKGSACQNLRLKDEPTETIFLQDHIYSTLKLQIEHSYACSEAKLEEDLGPNQDKTHLGCVLKDGIV